MINVTQINISSENIAEFCRRNHIRNLSFFGSFLRDDFRPESDHIPGLIRMAGMEIELSKILGHKVDLRTAEDLSRYFRQNVIDSAEVVYAQG